ncbi:MAG TPA: hypothetical protein VN841_29155 [Bryobacteraceae bacterium]|nr:hypothetical protein [Bryobacteraceae bacterium]
MPWTDSVERAHAQFLATWGIPAILLSPASQPGHTFSITGVIKNPGMEEELLPGSAAGVSAVRLWVDYKNITPQPLMGDQISIDGVNYDVGKVEVDIEGGAVLKLRRNG